MNIKSNGFEKEKKGLPFAHDGFNRLHHFLFGFKCKANHNPASPA
jgi:hypothetical protein